MTDYNKVEWINITFFRKGQPGVQYKFQIKHWKQIQQHRAEQSDLPKI